MSLVYTGTFNDALPPSPHDRTPFYLIEAVGRLALDLRRRLRIRLVGNVGRRYRQLIRGRSLEAVFELPGSVTHRDALREQAAADVALLVLTDEGGAQGDVTAKLFEYMGSRCPVLALAPEAGEAARLIRTHDLGWVEPPLDVERIARRLEWLVRAWGKGELLAATSPVPEFEASSQAGQLARLLDQVVDEAASSSDTTRSAARPSP